MNALTDVGTFVQDKLFATLDTKTGVCKLENGQKVLISDTVGFIQKLPHHLVSSFKATLEEARHADLLLHVVDVSSPVTHKQIAAVESVLKELGCDNKPTIIVFNKIDVLKDVSVIPLLQSNYKDSVMISAKTHQGITELRRRILETIERNFMYVDLSCSAGNGKLIAYLHGHANIMSEQYVEEQATFRLLIDKKIVQKIQAMDDSVQIKEVINTNPSGV